MKLEELKTPTTDEEAEILKNLASKAFQLLGIYYEQKESEFKESLYALPTFGDRLRALREHNHLTKADLVRRSGVCRDSIRSYEKGEVLPNTKALIAFANCFNVTVDLLFGNRPKERRQ